MVLAATQLGSAVVASALSPDEGLAVFAELQKARRCFVLENELHVIYLVSRVIPSKIFNGRKCVNIFFAYSEVEVKL